MKSTIQIRATLLGAASVIGLVCAPAYAQDSQTTPPGSANSGLGTSQSATPNDASSPTNGVVGPQAAPDQAASPSQTTAEADNGNEIVVTGIRAAQARAINLKRNAASVTDSISAEDIGKLPDVTIADSLQRITGVQITRSAGEGDSVNIRGLPQVVTLLNGETYIGANSIVGIQPRLSDIPSQLFAGADVIKSPTADLLNAGITGTLNLRTRRPLDLKSGLTVAGTAEADYGDRVKHKFDPNFNGLISWRNENFGVLFSGAYSNNRLSNLHNGIQEGYGATLHNEGTADVTSTNGFSPAIRPHGTAAAGGIDVNGDGDANDTFITPQGFTAWERINQRKRLGLNGAIQWQPTESLSFVGEAFYTKQNEYDRTAGIQQQNVNWQAGEFLPGQSRDTGVVVNGFNLNTIQVYNYDLGSFDSYSQTDHFKSQSQNYNAELKWDNGGPFKASIRGVYSKASQDYDQSYTQFSLSNGKQWNNGIGHYPDGDRQFNPNGYTVNTQAQANGVAPLPLQVDFTGNKPVFTLPGQLTSLLADPANYALKTISSEGNYRRDADQKIVRADASYEFSDALNIEFGARYSDRQVDDYEFERVAPLYAGQASQPGGCLVKWKGADVPINDKSCYAGTPLPGATAITIDPVTGNPQLNPFTASRTRPATDPSFNGQVKSYNLPAAGLPGIYVLDPHAMDNANAYQNAFYPGEVEHQNPGPSFGVGVKQVSGYFQINGKGDLFGIPVQANGGLRIINTKLDILQYQSGTPLPYGLSNTIAGTIETKRSFTDYLPAFNVAFSLRDNLKLRFALARTMTLLNLDQWGGGLNTFYAIDATDPTNPVFRVTGGNSTGNPALDPWRATNYEGSLEYYLGRASLVNVGAFYIDVDSFIQSGSVLRNDLPDNDGVVRNRTVSIATNIQGTGGTLKGVEAGAKLSMSDVLSADSFLAGFGLDANGTLSPSTTSQKDLAGRTIPFQDNSKYQTNVAVFFEKYGLSARVAWNYRSKRAVSSDFGGITGLEVYQKPTNYIDANISYDVTPNFTVYGQASNLTGEYEKYYLTWTDEKAYNQIFERRFAVGVRAKF